MLNRDQVFDGQPSRQRVETPFITNTSSCTYPRIIGRGHTLSYTSRVPPETRYAKSPNGLIAYQAIGAGPIDLVYLSGSTSHVDVRWEDPLAARFLNRLGSFSRLICFDRRGSGASDPIRLDRPPSWEEWADDLRVVLDAVVSERAALFAVLDAGPMAMLFAATNPQRVRALVLSNTTSRFVEAPDYPIGVTPEFADSLLKLLEEQWGTPELADLVNPELAADPSQRTWFAKYMRASATPHSYASQFRSVITLDVRKALPIISAPTLVLHRRDLRFVPPEQGKYLAENIPGARFVELPGSDASMFSQDGDGIVDIVEEFLTGASHVAVPDRVLATVLFTDLVDSTSTAAELGDKRWHELLDRHDQIVTREIGRERGRILKTTGDGVLATFDSPGGAIRSTFTIRDAIRDELDLVIRAGIHAGEIELRGDDVGGIAVHIAGRVSNLAGPGEVLVTRTVSDLVAGSGVGFADRGTHSLKGVPGEWQLLAAN